MQKFMYFLFLFIIVFLSGCKGDSKSNVIKFGTSADYPPFEYFVDGKIDGFDIELGRLIAHELKKEAVFEDMQFSAILSAIKSNYIDAAISTITVTQERKNEFDFSDEYYVESLSVVFFKNKPISDKSQLYGKKIACQLGTTMDIWLKKNAPNSEIILVDNNNQAIEALKAGHVDGVLIDEVQGMVFSQKNKGLASSVIAKSDTGYAIALPKGSGLKNKINSALKSLERKGELEKLKQKWLGEKRWKK